MGEVFDFRRKKVGWTIIIDSHYEESIDIRETDSGDLLVCMFVSDFDRIDNLRKQAEALLRQHKRRMDYVD